VLFIIDLIGNENMIRRWSFEMNTHKRYLLTGGARKVVLVRVCSGRLRAMHSSSKSGKLLTAQSKNCRYKKKEVSVIDEQFSFELNDRRNEDVSAKGYGEIPM
jgi:hypothetical protein